MKRLPVLLFILLLVIWLGALLSTSGGLPERVASRFGTGGEVTSWTPRESLVKTLLLVGVAAPVALVSVFWAMRFIPARFVNLPENARLWLEPEYRDRFNLLMLNFGAWLGITTQCFVASLYGLVVSANRQTPPRLDDSLIVMLAMVFLAAEALVILIYLVPMMRPPKVR